MEKVEAYTLIYDTGDRLLRFDVTCKDEAIPYGFCKNLGEWGWCYKDLIKLESGKLIRAKLIGGLKNEQY